MNMNVVLLHFGIYDERQPDYAEKYPLYKKCYDSVLREFKNDNILVFHSMEEIFEKFPNMKKIIENNKNFLEFQKKFSKTYFAAYLDLIRLLFTYFLDDCLYLDSDMYIFPTFKKELFSKFEKDKIFYCRKGGIAIFYSKTFTPSLQKFFKRFTIDYTIDSIEIKKCELLNRGDVKDCVDFNLIDHFVGLSFIREKEEVPIKKVKKVYTDLAPTDIMDIKPQIIYNNSLKRIYVSHNPLVGIYSVQSTITFEDFIKTIGYKNKIKEYDTLEEALND